MRKLMFGAASINKILDRKANLARLLRIIFYKLSITLDDFIELHSAYFRRMNTMPTKISHDRNNLRRTLDEDELSLRMFRHTVLMILHVDILRISITIKDPKTGEERTFHSDEDIPPDSDEAVDNGFDDWDVKPAIKIPSDKQEQDRPKFTVPELVKVETDKKNKVTYSFSDGTKIGQF